MRSKGGGVGQLVTLLFLINVLCSSSQAQTTQPTTANNNNTSEEEVVINLLGNYSTPLDAILNGPRNFSGSGGGRSEDELKQWADNPKLIPNDEWSKRLTPEQYYTTRESGTEAPFSGQYVSHKAEGVYTCVCCGSDLFSSKAKFDSGTGWPSFSADVTGAKGQNSSAVLRRADSSHGMDRAEILCNRCNAHLGHVFNDGPEPTGERFCVNSGALKFVPKKV